MKASSASLLKSVLGIIVDRTSDQASCRMSPPDTARITNDWRSHGDFDYSRVVRESDTIDQNARLVGFGFSARAFEIDEESGA